MNRFGREASKFKLSELCEPLPVLQVLSGAHVLIVLLHSFNNNLNETV